MSWERFSTSVCTDQQGDYLYLKEQISWAVKSPLQVTEVEVDENTFKSFCHQLDLRLRHEPVYLSFRIISPLPTNRKEKDYGPNHCKEKEMSSIGEDNE